MPDCLLPSLSITHGNNLFLPSTYLCCRGFSSRIQCLDGRFYFIFLQVSLSTPGTRTNLLCLHAPHAQGIFATTNVSILTEALKCDPQDCFSLRSTDLSAFSEFVRAKLAVLQDRCSKRWPSASQRQNAALHTSGSLRQLPTHWVGSDSSQEFL